nr:AraC family transcriptional regulator [uncultured Draconibacterium sp.]
MKELSTEIETQNLSFRNYKSEQFTSSIESFWFVETFAEEVNIVIPPNQFIDWIFLLNDKGYFHNGNFITESRLEGIMLKPVYLRLPSGIKALGVRLYGNGLYPFLPLNGKDLINKNIAYTNSAHENLIEEIKTASGDEAIIKATYQLLNHTYCAKREKETKLVKEFYSFLKANEDLSDIQTFCSLTKTNYTTLNRNFNKILGITAKKFERLIKFRKAVRALINSPERLTDVVVDSGYFDQSHFIKEFKHYMGMSPSEYLNLLQSTSGHATITQIDLSVI